MASDEQFNVFEEVVRSMHSNTSEAIKGALFGVGLTLGTFNGNSLTLDNFNQEITDYLILDLLNLKSSYSTEESHEHSHTFNIPGPLQVIKQGDRVLVAEIGAECVIIGRVSGG